MNVPRFNDRVTQQDALRALREYKAHRATYDDRDWEIEKIYRQISKGKIVISVSLAIEAAGVDQAGRPKLAIARADSQAVGYDYSSDGVITFNPWPWNLPGRWKIAASCPLARHSNDRAQLPRIPPQHRPAAQHLKNYWILWEADWKAAPRDPFLLRRVGKDAWIVLAAWDLTDVEMSVLRAHA